VWRGYYYLGLVGFIVLAVWLDYVVIEFVLLWILGMRLNILSEVDNRRHPQLIKTTQYHDKIEVEIRIWNTLYTYELDVNAPALNAIKQLRIPKAAFRGLNTIKKMDPNPRVEEITSGQTS